MRVGVYVGSFNPVHKGHKQVVDYLINNNFVDKIMVIPTGNYWHKNNLIDVNHRINMLKYYANNNIIINDELNDLQYTYQVLRELKTEGDLYLIIGSDNLPKLHLWENIDEILNYKIIVLQRDDVVMNDYIKNFNKKKNFILVPGYKSINISSTQIRNSIEMGEPLNNFLDEKVSNYIKKNNLYGEYNERNS